MEGQQITDPGRRGRKPKEESRAEEFHEKTRGMETDAGVSQAVAALCR